MESLLDAIQNGWQPHADTVGASSKELLGCMSWVGRKNAMALVKDMLARFETSLKKLSITIWEGCNSVLVSPNCLSFNLPH